MSAQRKPTARRRTSTQRAAVGTSTMGTTTRASGAPGLRFQISPALRRKTLGVLDAIEGSKKCGDHRGSLADIVVELNEVGTSYFFLRPLQLGRVGFVVRQLVGASLAANQRVMASAIRNVIARLEDQQVLFVSRYLRALMT